MNIPYYCNTIYLIIIIIIFFIPDIVNMLIHTEIHIKKKDKKYIKHKNSWMLDYTLTSGK